MTSPADYAVVPAFLHFHVRDVVAAMGTVHGGYDELQRSIEAILVAEEGQRITSEPGGFDKLTGTLLISEVSDLDRPWIGSITRTQRMWNPARFMTWDYSVHLELAPAGFNDLVALMHRDAPWTSLLLNFQNIDGPVSDDPLERPIPWDDVAYPCVALTSFRLATAPAGAGLTPP